MALEFTGDADRLVWNDASFLVGLSALTFSCWIKCNASLPYDIGFFKTNDTWGSDDGIGIRYDAVGANGGGTSILKCGISLTGTGETNVETSINSQTNEWQFVTMAWQDGEEIGIYLDGQLDTPSDSDGIGTGVTAAGNVDQIFFGTGAKGSGTTGWNGLMEDIRFYDRRLSSQEIETMYNTRGNDAIVNNLLFRVLFNELPVGQTATTGSIVDLSGRLGPANTVGGTPTYTESPGFASRRRIRN